MIDEKIWHDLIVKLTETTVGGLELDREIYRLTTKEATAAQIIADFRKEFNREPSDKFKQNFIDSEQYALDHPQSYTTSMDTALRLVPEGWTIVGIPRNADGRWCPQLAQDWKPGRSLTTVAEGQHDDLIIALVIACLTAYQKESAQQARKCGCGADSCPCNGVHDFRPMSWKEAYPASSGRVCKVCDLAQLGWFWEPDIGDLKA